MPFQIEDAPVDVRETGFVQRGVRDTTTAEAITAIGAEAKEAFVGAQAAGIEEEVEAEVGGLISTAVDEGLDVPLGAEDLSLLSDAQREVSRFRRAGRMGAVSKSELDARIEAVTRRYINKAPGLAEEFRKFAAGSRGDYESTISYIESQRRAATSGAGAAQKAFEKDLVALGAPASWAYGSDEQKAIGRALVEKNAPMSIAADQWQQISTQATAIANMTSQQQKIAAPSYIANSVRTFDNEMFTILGVTSYDQVVPDPKTEKATITTIEAWKGEQEALFNKTFTHADAAHRDSFFRNLNAKVDTVKKMLSGEIASVRSQAVLSTYQNEAALEFAGEHGVLARTVMGMERAIPGSTTGDSPLAKIIASSVQDVFSRTVKGSLTSGTKVNSLDHGKGDNMSAEQIDMVLDINRNVLGKAKGIDSKERDDVVIERGLNTLAGLDVLGVQGKLTQRHYIKIFDIMAQENWSALKNKYPTEVARIETLADGAVTGYLAKAAKSMSNQVARNKELLNQVHIGVNTEGVMSFIPNTPNDKSQADNLNATYQFGLLSKAFSQIKGVPQALTLQTLAERGVLPPFEIRVQGE